MAFKSQSLIRADNWSNFLNMSYRNNQYIQFLI